MVRSLALALSAVLLLPPTSTLAAPPEAPDAEPRVRLTAPEVAKERLVGTLAAVEQDIILLRVEGEARPLTVRRDLVTKWEVSRGRHSHVSRNAAWGLLGGVVVGTALIAATYEDDGFFSAGEAFAVGAGLFGGIGALLGALVGVNKTESWDEVDSKSLRLAVIPAPRGVGVSLRWTFGSHARPRHRERRPATAVSVVGPPAPADR